MQSDVAAHSCCVMSACCTCCTFAAVPVRFSRINPERSIVQLVGEEGAFKGNILLAFCAGCGMQPCGAHQHTAPLTPATWKNCASREPTSFGDMDEMNLNLLHQREEKSTQQQ